MSLGSLQRIYVECNIKHYGIDIKHLSSILVLEMQKLFLSILTKEVYDLVQQSDAPDEQKCMVTQAQTASYGGASLCSMFRIFYSRTYKEANRAIYIGYCKRLVADCHNSEEISNIPKQITYSDQGGLYILTPKMYAVCNKILNDLLGKLNVSLNNAKQLPDFNAMIKNYGNNVEYNNTFMDIMGNTTAHPEYLAKMKRLFLRMMCNKLIWSILKQQNWDDIGFSLRDQFKFDYKNHLDRTNQVN
eukprot:337170_1